MAKKHSNVTIYRFRVIMDTEEDVFRDIEIETTATFEELHRSVLDAFDFEEGEMASFYMSNESWEKGLEIPLMDMKQAEGASGVSMSNTQLADMVSKPADKVLYVYDFLRMWIFYIELIEIKKDTPSTIYPRVALVYGDAPAQDSKEMDLFGEEFSQEEFNELNSGGGGDDEDDDEFAENDEYFDENDFDGSYEQRDDY
ncbi:MAG: IS1096 element passenger TnpR family protein [Flavobacteriales bacterium]